MVVPRRSPRLLAARASAGNTLPPTLLFTGPAGVGKWQAAVATAQTLNCLTPVRPAARDPSGVSWRAGQADRWAVDACGTCRSCERIARGIHVDVLAIDPDDKASIKIDVIRDVLARTLLPAVRGPAPRGAGPRSRDTRGRVAERAAEVARRAAAGHRLHPHHVVPGRPARRPCARASMTLRFGRLTAGGGGGRARSRPRITRKPRPARWPRWPTAASGRRWRSAPPTSRCCARPRSCCCSRPPAASTHRPGCRLRPRWSGPAEEGAHARGPGRDLPPHRLDAARHRSASTAAPTRGCSPTRSWPTTCMRSPGTTPATAPARRSAPWIARLRARAQRRRQGGHRVAVASSLGPDRLQTPAPSPSSQIRPF